ncbi:MAG: hypothetical protein ACKOYN_00665, partial [Planctomycetota bacterium]
MLLATVATFLCLAVAEPPAPAGEPTAPPQTQPTAEPTAEPGASPTREPAALPSAEPPAAEPPTAEPLAPPEPAPSDAPSDKPASETPAAESPATKPVEEPRENPAATPPPAAAEPTLVPEKPTRAYVVIDRISTAAGTIESEDTEVIVLRDPKGKVRSFSKNRVISVTHLLDGPEGRRVRVVFNDGRQLVANLIDDGFEKVVLDIKGVRTSYDRAAVTAVAAYPTDAELYARFRASLEPDQYEARYTLATWLHGRRMYAEAKAELEGLLETTNHFEAKRLLTEVNAQLALLAPRDKPAPRDGRDDGTPAKADPVRGRILTPAEVNLIKVYELDLRNPPRMRVPDELIRTMIEKYADSALIPAKAAERTAFYSKDPAEIVATLFALKARELYGDVDVMGEPEQLNLFRTRVHNTWLIGNCATSRCHGGADGGRLYLHNRNHKNDEVRYTNMLIVLRTSIDGRALVDFERPTDSLLYQYALPRTEARQQHPDVRGWEPVFTPSRRELAEDFVKWVGSMHRPRPDYPVEYEPPALNSPDRPDPHGP